MNWYRERFLWNCSQESATSDKQFSISSGNGFVLSGNKHLPEPILTKIGVDIKHHMHCKIALPINAL